MKVYEEAHEGLETIKYILILSHLFYIFFRASCILYWIILLYNLLLLEHLILAIRYGNIIDMGALFIWEQFNYGYIFIMGTLKLWEHLYFVYIGTFFWRLDSKKMSFFAIWNMIPYLCKYGNSSIPYFSNYGNIPINWKIWDH